MRAARGEGPRGRERSWQEDGEEGVRATREDVDGPSDEGDDRDEDGDDDGDGDGAGAARAGGDDSGGDPTATGDQGGPGQGIGNQQGGPPLGERGSLETRGHAHEAKVQNGAGPTRAQVIQSAAQRGFARTPYRDVYSDYQAAVEESMDSSAVPPGRRFIVRRYFQLIRPQSPRPTR